MIWFIIITLREFKTSSLQVEDLADKRLSTCSTHYDLCVSSWSKGLVGLCFLNLIKMLSVGINSIKVGSLGIALLLKGLILGFALLVISDGVDLHDLHLLLGVDQHSLGIGFGLVQMGDCFGFDLVDNDSLLTLGLSD